MKLLVICSGISILLLSGTAAMSQDRLIGKLTLTAASGHCPETLALTDQSVPVNIVLPETGAGGPAPVQNRFRFNYKDAPPVVHSVTITGEIADYGAPGCTVAFRGEGVSVD